MPSGQLGQVLRHLRRLIDQFFAAFAATELDLYALAMQKTQEEQQQVVKARQQQLQRLRYEAQ